MSSTPAPAALAAADQTLPIRTPGGGDRHTRTVHRGDRREAAASPAPAARLLAPRFDEGSLWSPDFADDEDGKTS
ncbi:hypothetical protein [Kitasatospora sp. NPDC051164]|uniref:hypothetical protein n=1 Tax=Kitasatospora sp. NPDC051164 TaxID=3364055 RepID=UPI0037B2B2F9